MPLFQWSLSTTNCDSSCTSFQFESRLTKYPWQKVRKSELASKQTRQMSWRTIQHFYFGLVQDYLIQLQFQDWQKVPWKQNIIWKDPKCRAGYFTNLIGRILVEFQQISKGADQFLFSMILKNLINFVNICVIDFFNTFSFSHFRKMLVLQWLLQNWNNLHKTSNELRRNISMIHWSDFGYIKSMYVYEYDISNLVTEFVNNVNLSLIFARFLENYFSCYICLILLFLILIIKLIISRSFK